MKTQKGFVNTKFKMLEMFKIRKEYINITLPVGISSKSETNNYSPIHLQLYLFVTHIRLASMRAGSGMRQK